MQFESLCIGFGYQVIKTSAYTPPPAGPGFGPPRPGAPVKPQAPQPIGPQQPKPVLGPVTPAYMGVTPQTRQVANQNLALRNYRNNPGTGANTPIDPANGRPMPGIQEARQTARNNTADQLSTVTPGSVTARTNAPLTQNQQALDDLRGQYERGEIGRQEYKGVMHGLREVNAPRTVAGDKTAPAPTAAATDATNQYNENTTAEQDAATRQAVKPEVQQGNNAVRKAPDGWTTASRLITGNQDGDQLDASNWAQIGRSGLGDKVKSFYMNPMNWGRKYVVGADKGSDWDWGTFATNAGVALKPVGSWIKDNPGLALGGAALAASPFLAMMLRPKVEVNNNQSVNNNQNAGGGQPQMQPQTRAIGGYQ